MEEIVHQIRRQKNKSTDLMNVPVFVYKILAPIISPTVSMLINNSLSEGTFPECCKTAKIITIFKSGDSNSIIIIYHYFLPTPRRGSPVKSDKTHTQSSRYTP